jgi:hypothetical protein
VTEGKVTSHAAMIPRLSLPSSGTSAVGSAVTTSTVSSSATVSTRSCSTGRTSSRRIAPSRRLDLSRDHLMGRWFWLPHQKQRVVASVSWRMHSIRIGISMAFLEIPRRQEAVDQLPNCPDSSIWLKVRFPPNSDRSADILDRQFCAKSRRHTSQRPRGSLPHGSAV